MRRLPLFLLAALFCVVGYSSAQQQVERKGLKSKINYEQVISGHLTELNGKYKLRINEVTLEPGGYVSQHEHVGPGIRYVVSGELTLVQEGKTMTYKTGDYFFESGDVGNAAYNRAQSPVTIIQYEILTCGLEGGIGGAPEIQMN